MLQRLGQFACVIAFFAICGGHWAVLQTVAWTQMLRDYSEESGLVLAIQQTFSGERPCSMCITITEGRQKENQLPASVNFAKKFELPLVAVTSLLSPPTFAIQPYFSEALSGYPLRTEAPPAPVPIV